MKTHNLNHSRTILQTAYQWYKTRRGKLSKEQLNSLETQMLSLESSIQADDKENASIKADQLEDFTNKNFKKTFFDYIKEFLTAITVALVLAVAVKQMWFEPYEIPTGSMRPTFKEQDHVTVTKTPFGLNIPMMPAHFIFDPTLVQRTGIVTFTSENIEGLDEYVLFLNFIPYKKRLIKRLIGKPGDSLYFYGGKIYGVDSNGKPIEELIASPWMQNLEHIPFMDFDGEISSKNKKEYLISQNKQQIGKLTQGASREFNAEIFDGKKWIKEDPAAQKSPHDTPKAYSDLLGIGNYAMAQLLTKDQLKLNGDLKSNDIPDAPLYLELRHHPSLTNPKLLGSAQKYMPVLNPSRTVIPLQQSHLDAIMDNMYTARLVFKNGKGTRYSVDRPRFGSESPTFDNVPDGTYEFYHGQLSNVGWGAILSTTDKANPLYSHDPLNVQKLFNQGINMNNVYNSIGAAQYYFPTRYAYFRDGDLYLLGAPIIKKDDPTLVKFNEQESLREKNSSAEKPYIAFKDNGPPLKDGTYDIEKIRTFGLTIPAKSYYVLGDNHAMSADSRVFGFLPEDNLQGAPSLIVWPPGERFGIPPQKPYQLFNISRVIVWTIAGLGLLIWWYLHRRYLHRPIVLLK